MEHVLSSIYARLPPTLHIISSRPKKSVGGIKNAENGQFWVFKHIRIDLMRQVSDNAEAIILWRSRDTLYIQQLFIHHSADMGSHRSTSISSFRHSHQHPPE